MKTAEGTIKIHRKNIYRKPGIDWQAELFSLFINCNPLAALDEPTNPLIVYQSKPRPRKTTALLNATEA